MSFDTNGYIKAMRDDGYDDKTIVEELVAHGQPVPKELQPSIKKDILRSPVTAAVGHFASGLAKSLPRALAGAASIGEKAGAGIASAVGAIPKGTYPLGQYLGGDPTRTFGEQVREEVLPLNNTGEKVGGFVGDVAQFVGAGGQIPKAGLAAGVNLAREAGLGLKAAKVLGVAGGLIGSGAEFATVAAAQKGTAARFPSDLAIGTAAAGVTELLLKKPLTKAAELLYKSALKPPPGLGIEAGKQAVKTGLKERIFLTEGGVEKLEGKITESEKALDDVIKESGGKGTVSLKGIREYVEPIKAWFQNQADVVGGHKAAGEIDDMLNAFEKQYGDEISVELAQEIKTNTYRILKNAYDEITYAGAESQKQMARFLKEGIVKVAPKAQEINGRLAALYNLDEVLQRAYPRISNQNIFSLGSQVVGAGAAAATGIKGGLGAAGAVGILSKAPVRSAIAIGLNELGRIAGGLKIPLELFVSYLADELAKQKQQEQVPQQQ